MSDENMNIKWECYVLQVELILTDTEVLVAGSLSGFKGKGSETAFDIKMKEFVKLRCLAQISCKSIYK